MPVKNPRHSLLLAALVAVGVSVGVAACGGSSSHSTSANAAAGSGAGAQGAPTGPTGPSGPSGRSARFAAVRECLQKNGITPPQRTPGQGPGGGFFGGGGQLPNGVSREKLEEALKKCGLPARPGRFGAAGRFNSARRTQALTKFASCMREHGVNLPTPNTSGTGPVFDTKGLSTATPQFRAALATCRAELTTLFRPGGATGSTGEVKTD